VDFKNSKRWSTTGAMRGGIFVYHARDHVLRTISRRDHPYIADVHPRTSRDRFLRRCTPFCPIRCSSFQRGYIELKRGTSSTARRSAVDWWSRWDIVRRTWPPTQYIVYKVPRGTYPRSAPLREAPSCFRRRTQGRRDLLHGAKTVDAKNREKKSQSFHLHFNLTQKIKLDSTTTDSAQLSSPSRAGPVGPCPLPISPPLPPPSTPSARQRLSSPHPPRHPRRTLHRGGPRRVVLISSPGDTPSTGRS